LKRQACPPATETLGLGQPGAGNNTLLTFLPKKRWDAAHTYLQTNSLSVLILENDAPGRELSMGDFVWPYGPN